ncbi:FMN-binding domain protein [Streptomyces xiamenensis]|uniref:FMN-binding domain protein n=1 Tax=Streptomyces xiamenensis TaxID=408015 RepID=A0A0F7CQM3_9ACTN|nr:FMN-binding protein [Streptomyces xiamenensis]AKG46661.1 FMN-binding domain protein [Streptomyces xiamenensis]
MHRAAIAAVTTVAGVVALLSLKPHAAPAALAPAPPAGDPPPAVAPGPDPTGTFTGKSIDTPFGPVQVAVTLDQGRITGVRALRTPGGDPRSEAIAAESVPRLTQEVLRAQSVHVDAVSGASYTSQGYLDSLQSALDQAGG